MPHKNIEDRRAYDRKRRQTESAKKIQKEASHKWYLENKDAVRKQTKRWTSKNKSRYNEYRRKWESDNREKSGWAREIRVDFNITVEQYYKIFTKQAGCCAICGISQKDLKSRLAIDHNHKTGTIRGLLCFNCNTSLGKWGDDSVIVKKALDYLNGYK